MRRYATPSIIWQCDYENSSIQVRVGYKFINGIHCFFPREFAGIYFNYIGSDDIEIAFNRVSESLENDIKISMGIGSNFRPTITFEKFKQVIDILSINL